MMKAGYVRRWAGQFILGGKAYMPRRGWHPRSAGNNDGCKRNEDTQTLRDHPTESYPFSGQVAMGTQIGTCPAASNYLGRDSNRK